MPRHGKWDIVEVEVRHWSPCAKTRRIDRSLTSLPPVFHRSNILQTMVNHQFVHISLYCEMLFSLDSGKLMSVLVGKVGDRRFGSVPVGPSAREWSSVPNRVRRSEHPFLPDTKSECGKSATESITSQSFSVLDIYSPRHPEPLLSLRWITP
jgi:hypothetical protein